MLKEVTMKIRLKRINMQEEVTVEALLDSGVIELVMSSEFAQKQRFKLKKIKKPIYVRNVNSSFIKEGPIEYIIEINVYYQKHRKRTEIDVIGGQKWSVILEILWFTHHSPKISWRMEEVKIMRCLEECGKQ